MRRRLNIGTSFPITCLTLTYHLCCHLNKPYRFQALFIGDFIVCLVMFDVVVDHLCIPRIRQVRIPIVLLSKADTDGAKLWKGKHCLIFKQLDTEEPIIFVKWRSKDERAYHIIGLLKPCVDLDL